MISQKEWWIWRVHSSSKARLWLILYYLSLLWAMLRSQGESQTMYREQQRTEVGEMKTALGITSARIFSFNHAFRNILIVQMGNESNWLNTDNRTLLASVFGKTFLLLNLIDTFAKNQWVHMYWFDFAFVLYPMCVCTFILMFKYNVLSH